MKSRGRGRGGKAKGKAASEPAQNEQDIKEKLRLNPRTCTGQVTSHPRSRDLRIEKFSLSLHGFELISDTTIELNHGQRYGLIGLNGSGKSSLLDCLGQREIAIPEAFDMFHLSSEIEASDKTALQAVMEDLETRRAKLEAEAEALAEAAGGDDELAAGALEAVYETLDELEASGAEARAAEILWGLGFSAEMQRRATREFSGGWRMRIALAKALFMRPSLLLLDEPTNHLDLEACVWLEAYLRRWKHILLLVSHSQDFLNAVCTDVIRLHQKKLTYWGGNYDTYVRTRAEKEANQQKQYEWEQDQIANMKEYIARFGHGSAKLAAQAKSKEKTLARMIESGLTERVQADHVLRLSFNDPGELPPPHLQFNMVTFAYPGREQPLFRGLDIGVDLDSRVAIVGANGTGKSTLLKLMVGDLVPTDGMVKRHQHLRLGWYHQHLAETLDLELTPLKHMTDSFPTAGDGPASLEQLMRRALGRFGISGALQTSPMRILSDGMKSRVALAWIAFKNPHVLLLDEPTNHLDLETIDSLAAAINDFPGGLVLVSHDFRLINQVAKEIWEVRDQNVVRWNGDIAAYKEHLKRSMKLD
jgi:ATP-binding cassette subfamily F protein 2